jgi:hypothetical protein
MYFGDIWFVYDSYNYMLSFIYWGGSRDMVRNYVFLRFLNSGNMIEDIDFRGTPSE